MVRSEIAGTVVEQRQHNEQPPIDKQQYLNTIAKLETMYLPKESAPIRWKFEFLSTCQIERVRKNFFQNTLLQTFAHYPYANLDRAPRGSRARVVREREGGRL